MDIENVGSD